MTSWICACTLSRAPDIHTYTRIVTRLNEVRDDHTAYNNRLDTTLADVFNLLSLFFLTIGKTRECPATYSQIASMRVSVLSFVSSILFAFFLSRRLSRYRSSILCLGHISRDHERLRAAVVIPSHC